MTTLLRLTCAVAFAAVCTFAPFASALEPPQGRVILTVDGAIAESNSADGKVRFDRSMLEQLGLQTLRTATPWTDGEQVFEGVTLAALLSAVGAHGSEIVARAINDYETKIPTSDAEEHRAFIALKANGEYLTVRNRGPLWVIYPWSDDPKLTRPLFQARAIWQLKYMTLR